ncbi:MAG: tRNA uracil 4-sulfurtransferase ThiI [Actinomycetota bacterium]
MNLLTSKADKAEAQRPGLVVAHYQELGLKGRNRSFFERKLTENLRRLLSGVAGAKVVPISGRVLIRFADRADTDFVTGQLACAFGLGSFSPAEEMVDPTLDELASKAIEMADESNFESFQVRARRGNSSFPISSTQINVAVGQAVKDHSGARVDLTNPQWSCHIELVTNKAYLYSKKLPGPGGLPVGTSGKVLTLLSGGIDSPVAAWRMARRGARVDYIHFHGQPFADPSSSRQATHLAKQLAPWTLQSKLWLVSFGQIQSEIVTCAPQELRIVLYRRFMMRIAEELALREGAQGLVTGECLGQVASQTITNLQAISTVVKTLPILRPLIGHDKLEIEHTGKQIGTYDISIQPHQDCCVLFTPRRVATAAKIPDLIQAESSLPVEQMVRDAVTDAQCTEIAFPLQ